MINKFMLKHVRLFEEASKDKLDIEKLEELGLATKMNVFEFKLDSGLAGPENIAFLDSNLSDPAREDMIYLTYWFTTWKWKFNHYYGTSAFHDSTDNLLTRAKEILDDTKAEFLYFMTTKEVYVLENFERIGEIDLNPMVEWMKSKMDHRPIKESSEDKLDIERLEELGLANKMDVFEFMVDSDLAGPWNIAVFDTDLSDPNKNNMVHLTFGLSSWTFATPSSYYGRDIREKFTEYAAHQLAGTEARWVYFITTKEVFSLKDRSEVGRINLDSMFNIKRS